MSATCTFSITIRFVKNFLKTIKNKKKKNNKMHLKQPGFTYSSCGPFTKTKKEFRNLKKQETRVIFTKTNLVRLVLSMTWLMEILRIYQEEQLLIKF